MHKRLFSLLLGGLALALLAGQLQPVRIAHAAFNGYDLVASVNALRRSKGLAELKLDGALMNSAQGHSDYQASIGSWTHTGPGGSTPTSRAKAAGFGGGATVFISENVAYNTVSASMDYVIYTVWSDSLHWNTMINPTYTHAGAGVTVKGNYAFITLDVGYIAGQPGATALPTTGAGTAAATRAAVTVIPTTALIVTSTRNPDGSVYHPVQYGQFLQPIAQAYGLTLSQIRQLNNMGPEDLLFAGQKLLIQPSFTPTLSPTVTRTSPPPTRTLTPTVPSPTPSLTATLTVTPTPTAPSPFAFLENTDRQTMAVAILGVSGLGLLLVLLSALRRKK